MFLISFKVIFHIFEFTCYSQSIIISRVKMCFTNNCHGSLQESYIFLNLEALFSMFLISFKVIFHIFEFTCYSQSIIISRVKMCFTNNCHGSLQESYIFLNLEALFSMFLISFKIIFLSSHPTLEICYFQG